MRYARHSKILEIIRDQEIDTQEKLAEKLMEAGFKATQATVSRDIRELGLVKVAGSSGRSRYAQPSKAASRDQDRYSKILKETVREIRAAENLIIIHTLSGCAGAAAEVIDNISPSQVVGTLAGDNTIFVAVDARENVPEVMNIFTAFASREDL